MVYGGGSLLRSSGRLTKKTLKAVSQLRPHRASQIRNQNKHKLILKRLLKRPSNALKLAIRKSRPPEPPIFNIGAFNNSIRELIKTFIKASKCYRKKLNSLPVPAIAIFLMNIIVLFNNKKLLILNSVKK